MTNYLDIKHNVVHLYLPCANSDRYIFSIVSIDDNKEVALISERYGFVPVKEWTGIVGTDNDEVLPFVAYDRFVTYVKDAENYVNSVSDKYFKKILSEQATKE